MVKLRNILKSRDGFLPQTMLMFTDWIGFQVLIYRIVQSGCICFLKAKLVALLPSFFSLVFLLKISLNICFQCLLLPSLLFKLKDMISFIYKFYIWLRALIYLRLLANGCFDPFWVIRWSWFIYIFQTLSIILILRWTTIPIEFR